MNENERIYQEILSGDISRYPLLTEINLEVISKIIKEFPKDEHVLDLNKIKTIKDVRIINAIEESKFNFQLNSLKYTSIKVDEALKLFSYEWTGEGGGDSKIIYNIGKDRIILKDESDDEFDDNDSGSS